MEEKITLEQYVQQKLSQRIAEQELRIHELEFMVFALKEEKENLQKKSNGKDCQLEYEDKEAEQ